MKFILQESKKFILEERFILNEADADFPTNPEAVTAAELLRTKFPDETLDKVLESSISKKVKKQAEEIIKAAEAVQNILKGDKKDITLLKGPVNTYLGIVDKILADSDKSNGSALNGLSEDAKDTIEALKNLNMEIERNFSAVETEFNKLHNAVASAIKINTTVDTSEAQELIKSFKHLRDSTIKTLEAEKNNNDTITNAISTFKDAIDKINIDITEGFNDCISKITEAKNLCSDIYDILNKETTADKEARQEADTTDWANRIKNAHSGAEAMKI